MTNKLILCLLAIPALTNAADKRALAVIASGFGVTVEEYQMACLALGHDPSRHLSNTARKAVTLALQSSRDSGSESPASIKSKAKAHKKHKGTRSSGRSKK